MTTQAQTLALARAFDHHDTVSARRLLAEIGKEAESRQGRPTAYSQTLQRIGRTLEEEPTTVSQYTDTLTGDDDHHLVLPDKLRSRVDGLIRERNAADRLASHGLVPASRILLSGRPGTGKTSLARLLGHRLGLPVREVRLDRLLASRLGETVSRVGVLFDQISEHEGLWLLDEADALLASRLVRDDVAEMRRVTNLILTRLDRWDSRSVLVAASNLTGLLDPAVLRRFDLHWTLPGVTAAEMGVRIIRQRLHELDMPVAGSLDEAIGLSVGLSPALVVRAVDRACRATIVDGENTMQTNLLRDLLREAHRDNDIDSASEE